ncbi:hypothetical protein Zmor_004479 [Zophobas morio]|uniref:Uncharacterized protein n=1 Tax=Zophobas morio TaxID=2755281 RepID=A0AA38M116_9CUCU|nr:hypothetical protein Zmor_004479 [Zophobas morio]
MQQGATMSFTLDYNGVGDSTSNADQQTTEIDSSKLDNFNPYQTKLSNQQDKLEQGALDKIDTSRTSGVVLGKDQLNMSDEDLMNYDGTGMLANIDNNKVHHYYKVE